MSVDRKTLEYYQSNVAQYDADTTDFWRKFKDGCLMANYFAHTVKATASGDRVVSLGAGPGRDAEILRELGLGVVCVDGSPEMTEITRTKGFQSYNKEFSDLPNLRKLAGVWMYTSVFTHLSRADAVDTLQRASRYLKPGGVLAIGAIEGEGELVRSNDGRAFTYWQRDGLMRVVEGAGFSLSMVENFTPQRRSYIHLVGRKMV